MAPSAFMTLLPHPGFRAVVGGAGAFVASLRWQNISCNLFLEFCYHCCVPEWSFFTNHARVLICIARDPGMRLRDLAAALNVTERSAHGIVTDLVDAGYVVKERAGRRNRYRVEVELPIPESIGRERAIGDVLAFLLDAGARTRPRQSTKEHHAE